MKARIELLKFFLIITFSVIGILAHAQITIEAEKYKSLGNGTSPIVLENAGATVGYFDEYAETITYSVTIPTAGYYEFSLRYLAGAAGKLSIEATNGAVGLIDFEAKNGDSWWTTPLASWLETTYANSPLFYFASGVQTFTLKNLGTGINLDYIKLSKSSITNTSISSIITNPSKIEVMPGKSLQIAAYAVNSDSKVIASPIIWSLNVPNGLFTAGSSPSVETASVSIGGITKTLNIKVAMPTKKRNFVVSQFGKLTVTESYAGANDWAVRGEKRQKASLAGPSLFWSCSAPAWWKKETIDWLVEDWHIQVVRCPVSIGPGMYDNIAPYGSYTPKYLGTTWNNNNYVKNPELAKNMMDEVIAAAIENDIYVIIDFHDHHSQFFKKEAIEFFDYFSKKWGKYPNILYEIFNEPFVNEQVNQDGYADAVCNTIRANDPSNVIIIGSKNYSRNPEFGASFYSHGNIAGTWHGYVVDNHQADWIGKSSWGNGTAIVVTEWGRNGNSDGGLVQTFKNAGVIQCSWTLNNKQTNGDENWSAFNSSVTKSSGWTSSELSASGQWMRDMMRGYGYVPPAKIDPDAVQLSLEADKTLKLPTSSTSIIATASTGYGTINYNWIQTSGPNTASFSANNIANPSINNLQIGMYSFKVTASNGIDTQEGIIKVTVLPQNYTIPAGGDVIDNVDDNDFTTLWGGAWSVFDDSNDKGASTITSAINLPNNNTVNASYTLNKGGWAYNPYCGVKVSMKKDGTVMDLTGCQKITYKYKGAAHDFRVQMAKIADNDYHKKAIPASSTLTTVTVDWSALAQDPAWGTDVGAIDKTNIDYFSWQVSAASGSGTIEIDDLTCVGAKGPVNNMPPVAYAGIDTSTVNNNISLNGKNSFDIEGDTISYAWTQVSGPNTATITNNSSSTPSFTNLINGTYIFRLAVSDGKAITADSIAVTVNIQNTNISLQLAKGWNLISIPVGQANIPVTTLFPNAEVVKTNDSFYKKGLATYFNSLTNIEGGKGYLVYNSVQETIVSNVVTNTTVSTSLKKGWNLIGVPNLLSLAVSKLPTETIIIKNFDGFYIPNNGLSQITELKSGNGYFIKVSADCVINW